MLVKLTPGNIDDTLPRNYYDPLLIWPHALLLLFITSQVTSKAYSTGNTKRRRKPFLSDNRT